MMEKFTKGEWKILPLEDDKEYIRIRGTVIGGRYKIADVHDLHFNSHSSSEWAAAEREESKANAALIAAAPEMYEILKTACGMFSGTEFSKRAEAILTKARGEQ